MAATTAVSTLENREVTYTPLGSKTAITMKVGTVRSFLCTPSRSGKMPDDSEVIRFLMLCKARELDPWVGDAYLIGYDSNDGPKFSLITAHQALLKRAELCPAFDGLESGVVVKNGDSIEFNRGDLVFDGQVLIGGWAKCHRKDRSHETYDAVKLSTFNTGKSRWGKDPAGMIVKCAEASVLRTAFPSQLGGLYTREEMDNVIDAPPAPSTRTSVPMPSASLPSPSHRNDAGDDRNEEPAEDTGEPDSRDADDATDYVAIACGKIDQVEAAGDLGELIRIEDWHFGPESNWEPASDLERDAIRGHLSAAKDRMAAGTRKTPKAKQKQAFDTNASATEAGH